MTPARRRHWVGPRWWSCHWVGPRWWDRHWAGRHRDRSSRGPGPSRRRPSRPSRRRRRRACAAAPTSGSCGAAERLPVRLGGGLGVRGHRGGPVVGRGAGSRRRESAGTPPSRSTAAGRPRGPPAADGVHAEHHPSLIRLSRRSPRTVVLGGLLQERGGVHLGRGRRRRPASSAAAARPPGPGRRAARPGRRTAPPCATTRSSAATIARSAIAPTGSQARRCRPAGSG